MGKRKIELVAVALHHIVAVFSKFQAPPNLHRSIEKASESD